MTEWRTERAAKHVDEARRIMARDVLPLLQDHPAEWTEAYRLTEGLIAFAQSLNKKEA